MADEYAIQPAAEFQNLPLETLMSAPLTGAVKAQVAAASATLEFIDRFMNTDANGNRTPITTSFTTKTTVSNPAPTAADPNAVTTELKNLAIEVPYLSILPIPNLLINKVSSEFEFAISQTLQSTTKVDATGALDVGVQAPVKWLVNASLKGSVTRSSDSSKNVSRSGSIKVSIEATQAAIPAGLDKVLTVLANSITATPQS